MAQGGCPDGTGAGGPDWAIKCEIDAPKQVHNRGSLSMAHAGREYWRKSIFHMFCSHVHT